MLRKPGIYPGICRAEYDKIPAINISTLVHGLRTMAMLRHIQINGEETTPALTVGIATHIAVYEPETLEARCIRAPEFKGKGAVKARKDFQNEHKDKIILKADEWNLVIQIRDSVRRYAPAKDILDCRGQGEVTVVWQDPVTGLHCKGLLDRFVNWMNWPTVTDLKTCYGSVAPDEFSREVAKHHYHVKAAWYLDGLSQLADAERRFIWIAVEKDAPYCVALHEADDQTIQEGRRIYRRLLNKYAECLKTDVWPGHEEGIHPLTLPKWAFEEREVLV